MTNIEVAIALALYAYNVSPHERAKKLYDHFDGRCMEQEDLVEMLLVDSAYLATTLPYPTAAVYVQHAMEKYGGEAKNRARVNEI